MCWGLRRRGACGGAAYSRPSERETAGGGPGPSGRLKQSGRATWEGASGAGTPGQGTGPAGEPRAGGVVQRGAHSAPEHRGVRYGKSRRQAPRRPRSPTPPRPAGPALTSAPPSSGRPTTPRPLHRPANRNPAEVTRAPPPRVQVRGALRPLRETDYESWSSVSSTNGKRGATNPVRGHQVAAWNHDSEASEPRQG